MRQIIQRLSRDVVLRRRLPERFGGAPIFVSPDAALRYWKPNLETTDPSLYASAAELIQPGDVVWDVGANMGLFAFVAAFLAGPTGRVIAFEPDAYMVGLLHRSSRALPAAYAPVDIVPVALSDSIGLTKLFIANNGRAANSLGAGNSEMGGSRATQSVMTVTLDWALTIAPPPAVLKVDVEGFEEAVLRGGSEMLAKVRPKIHCEMSTQAPFDQLKAFRYRMFDAEKSPETRQELDSYAFNTVAFPMA